MTFPELLLFRGIAFRPHSKPNELWVSCPFCDDSKFRLGINYERNVGHCFNGACNFKSRRVISSYLRALSIQEENLELPETVDQEIPQKPQLPEDFFPLRSVRRKDGYPLYTAKSYLLARNITKDQMRAHHMGVSLSGKWRYRVIVPILDGKKLKGFLGRDFTGKREPKYLNSIGERFLFNLSARAPGVRLVLCEGVFKALAIERLEDRFHGCALLGHSLKENQVEAILKAGWRKVAILPDPDRAGLLGSLKVADSLQEAGISVLFPRKPPLLQADDMRPERLSECLNHLEPYSFRMQLRVKLRAGLVS